MLPVYTKSGKCVAAPVHTVLRARTTSGYKSTGSTWYTQEAALCEVQVQANECTNLQSPLETKQKRQQP